MSAQAIPDAALDDRLGFVGTSGSGKTYNAGSGVERVLAMGGRVIVIDPLGVWWGMGLCADGISPAPWREKGRLVIFGGDHGDLPLNEHAGKLVGETCATMAESAVLDLSGLGTKAAEVRFMLAFLTALYRHSSGEPLHLIFDEADMWAPQQERDKGEAPRLLGMMETVIRRGRVRGFMPWLISQRPAVLNKNVLAMVDGLVTFKLTSSQDRKAIGEWVKGQADEGQWSAISGALPTLERGQALIWIPARGAFGIEQFPMKGTFDSSRTPTRGEAAERRELKPLNLDTLKGRLASIEDEAKANDPAALKAEVARLTKALNAALRQIKEPPAPQRIVANAAEIEAARAEGQRVGVALGITQAQEALKALRVDGPASSDRHPAPGRTPAQPREAPAPVVASAGVTGPQQRVLDAVAWWNTLGIEHPSNEQVSFIAGYSPSTSAYKSPKASARTAGWLDYPLPGILVLTDSGREIATAPTTAPSVDELHLRILNRLSGPQRRVFEPVLRAWPDQMSNDDLAAAAEYAPSTSAFKSPKSSLRTLSLITYPSPGQVRAADWLFP